MTVFQFALEQVGLTAVAFDEDIFSLHHAFFRRNGLYSFAFLTKPGHRNVGKGSTKSVDSKLDALLRANSRGEGMFYLCHLRHEISRFD